MFPGWDWKQGGLKGPEAIRPPGEAGFALPGVLLVVLLLSIIAVVSLRTTGDERVAGRAVLQSVEAFYAANAGVAAELAGFDRAGLAPALATPGDSVDLGWKTLEDGSRYRAVIRWVGGGALKLYSINVTGRGVSPNSGQREIRLHVAERVPPTCCTATIRGGVLDAEAELDSLGLGGVTVSGYDTIPAGWEAACDANLVDLPGIEWRDTTQVEVENGGLLLGNPRLVEDSTINGTNLFDWGALDYDSLVAMADITFPDGTGIQSGVQPVATGGTCDTSVSTNWGAPENPSHPCFDYFPIIHAQGGLEIKDNTGVGQGILLVDGELEIKDSFRFYGLIIVKGEVEFENDVRLYGAVVAGDKVEVEDGATVRYSRCATERALARVSVIRPLATRAWEQAMN